MKKRGIITGATVQVNFASLGYDALATLLVNVEAQQIDEAMEYVAKVTKVRAYRQYNSIHNIRAIAALKEINELDYVKQAIKRILPTVGLKTYIWTDIRNNPANLSITSKRPPIHTFDQMSSKPASFSHHETYQLDDLDLQIIDQLAANGRLPFTKIAKSLGTSTDTVVKRYHRLKRNGVIKVSIQVNLNKLGYKAILDISVCCSSLRMMSENIVDSLASIPDVIIITKTSGDYDLQLTAVIKSLDHSFAIQNQIAHICGITKMEASARTIPVGWPTTRQCISTF